MAGAAQHAHWSSRWAFIMAAVGSAVGLGNIWKFPYEAGQGGGGAFVMVYLLFVFFIGTPMLVAELSLGRRGQLSPIGSMKKIAQEEKRSPLWGLIGWSGVVGAFIVISFYSVVGGWTLAYMVKSAMGAFSNIDAQTAQDTFVSYISNPVMTLVSHFAFMGITIFIVAKGVQGGLEKAVTYLMPALFAILLVLVVYSGFTGDFAKTVDFLFNPDFDELLYKANSPEAIAAGGATKVFSLDMVLQALGQSFFSLSLALGSIMTYGSYLTRDVNVGRSALTIAAADSSVALMAGLAIFPIVFAYGLDVAEGGGLVFMSLPIAFGQMPFGIVVGTLFFGLLAVAAITSSISLLEPPVSYVEEKTGWNRRKVAITMGVAAGVLGVLSAYSQGDNMLSSISIFGLSIMDAKDFLTNNIIMPLGGLFTALFVGWFVSRKAMMEELAMEDKTFRIWYFLARFVSPTAIGIIFIKIIYDTVVG
ncbi:MULTISPECIES: sodium-dependent transporter [Kordiimonas]|jgi:NSS family neurotransmitter:Na+ symporter|uniref:sodium-dependent transporter n=1 Tax=Kordiimonas TaxID=288021 RepID=UPI00257DAC2A|nr:sodium-dependent transporter [Kordiimonas sp. UBA4487]